MTKKERIAMKKTHIKTIFSILRDAREKRDSGLVHMAAGYYTAVANQGYIVTALDRELMENIFGVHLAFVKRDPEAVGAERLESLTDMAEEVLLV